jgi:hypothetical protein
MGKISATTACGEEPAVTGGVVRRFMRMRKFTISQALRHFASRDYPLSLHQVCSQLSFPVLYQ